MKTTMTRFLVVLAMTCVMLKDMAHGLSICFDHNGQSTGDLWDNLGYLKSLGFTDIRTYGVLADGGRANLGVIITSLGMNAALGIPVPENTAETAAAIAAVRQHHDKPGKVKYILVGNENFTNEKWVPQVMWNMIYYLKDQVPGVKIGTSQRVTEYLDPNQLVNNMKDLVAALDVVGVNIHPIFTPGTDAHRGYQIARDQYYQINELNWKYPGISDKLMITEIGWPTDGEVLGNHGSVDGGRFFYQQWKEWQSYLPKEAYYFQAFDTPYKQWSKIEQNYGLCRSRGYPKWDV